MCVLEALGSLGFILVITLILVVLARTNDRDYWERYVDDRVYDEDDDDDDDGDWEDVKHVE